MSATKRSSILNNAKFKIQSCLLFCCILTSTDLFSQDKAPWQTIVIDSTIRLNLPANLDTTIIMDRLTMGRLEHEQVVFIFMKIDVIDTVPRPKDTIGLRNDYEKVLKGFLNRSKGELISKREIKSGDYIGMYIKAKVNLEGADYFIEQQTYSLNGDAYNLQIVYPLEIEQLSSDLRHKFLTSVIIAPASKQFSD